VHTCDECISVWCYCAGCETAEEYECVAGQPQGYVDVPAYGSAVAGTVSEDWDRGMMVLLL